MTNQFDFSILNNEGVSLLVAGEHSRAYECFKKALHTLRSSVKSHGDIPHSFQRRAQSRARPSPPITSFRKSVEIHNFQEEHALFMFGRAITCPDQDEYTASFPETNDCRLFDINLESAAILLNMALVHHKRAYKRRSDDLLEKADRLYELSINMSRNASITSGDKQMSEALTMAALNNKAQICYERNDYDQARTCLDELMGLLLESSDFSLCLDDQDIEGFMFNIHAVGNEAIATSVAPAA